MQRQPSTSESEQPLVSNRSPRSSTDSGSSSSTDASKSTDSGADHTKCRWEHHGNKKDAERCSDTKNTHSNGDVDGTRVYKCRIVLTCIALITAVLALILSLTFFVLLSSRTVSLESERTPDVGLSHCRPCRRVIDPAVSEGSYSVTKNASHAEQALCCTRIAASSHKGRGQDQGQVPDSEVYEYFNPEPVLKSAAHVYYEHPAGKRDTGKDVVKGWSHRGNNAYLRGCNYTNQTGRFTLTEDGVYTIYSHVTFDSPREDTAGSRNVAFSQKIRVDMKLQQKYHSYDLLEDTQQVTCGADVTIPCHVSSIVSTLYLRAEDQLFVEVSHMELIHGSTYFGFLRTSR